MNRQYVILHKPAANAEAITVMNDPSMTLYAWQLLIQELVAKHGPNAILSTDGGHNNVELVIEQSASVAPTDPPKLRAKHYR